MVSKRYNNLSKEDKSINSKSIKDLLPQIKKIVPLNLMNQ